MRTFESGATRDELESKPDYAGYLSPLVIERFGQYMLAHQATPSGFRASDNWKLGIPRKEYLSSMWRHFLAVWTWVETGQGEGETALCALLFNAQGMLHEELIKTRTHKR